MRDLKIGYFYLPPSYSPNWCLKYALALHLRPLSFRCFLPTTGAGQPSTASKCENCPYSVAVTEPDNLGVYSLKGLPER